MAERRQYFTALAPKMLEPGEHWTEHLILPPGADSLRLSVIDRDKFEDTQIDWIRRWCLGALVVVRVSVQAKLDRAERIFGGLVFMATAEEVATSPKEFKQLKQQRPQ